MAAYSRREVTTVRVEYFLPNPTNATEYAKAMSALSRELEGLGVKCFDDTVTVEGRDDEIVLSYQQIVSAFGHRPDGDSR